MNYIQLITQKTSLSHQEAIWLLEHITQKKYIDLRFLDLNSEQINKLHVYIDQINQTDKPLAYIIGWIPFLDLKISVKPPILIPRPETEEWVYNLIQKITPYKEKISKILEIGTGSGAIGLSLAQSFPKTQIYAIDINSQALDLARQNAQINKINNITFLQSDLFEKLEGQTFDLIVSNPPYIPQKASEQIVPSVIKWEDPKALFAGDLGTDILEKILKKAALYTTLEQHLPFQLILEIDTTHNEIISKICKKHDWDCNIQKDLFGNWRTAWCKKI